MGNASPTLKKLTNWQQKLIINAWLNLMAGNKKEAEKHLFKLFIFSGVE